MSRYRLGLYWCESDNCFISQYWMVLGGMMWTYWILMVLDRSASRTVFSGIMAGDLGEWSWGTGWFSGLIVIPNSEQALSKWFLDCVLAQPPDIELYLHVISSLVSLSWALLYELQRHLQHHACGCSISSATPALSWHSTSSAIVENMAVIHIWLVCICYLCACEMLKNRVMKNSNSCL